MVPNLVPNVVPNLDPNLVPTVVRKLVPDLVPGVVPNEHPYEFAQVAQGTEGFACQRDMIFGASVTPRRSSSSISSWRRRNFWIFVPDIGQSSTKRT